MPALQTKQQLIDEIHRTVSAATNQNFDRSAEARTNALFRLLDTLNASETKGADRFGRPQSPSGLATESFRQYLKRTIDPATLEFFSGHRPSQSVISVTGGRIQALQGVTVGGRTRGQVTALRDFSSVLDPENRTYAGLTTTTGGTDGGNLVPIGFIPTVLAAMKKTDGVLEAANWEIAATADGRPTNMPSLTDTGTSALKIAEAAAQTFANTTFGNISWPEATTWSSQVIKASVQIDTDNAVRLASLLAEAFRIRFARGFGAECVSILLADAPVGATSASPTALTQKDLLELVKSVDPAYASSDSAGWAMSWNTLLYIFENVTTSTTSGDALYHAQKDDRGHYLLLGKPIFVSPSLDDIGSGNKAVLFGDWRQGYEAFCLQSDRISTFLRYGFRRNLHTGET